MTNSSKLSMYFLLLASLMNCAPKTVRPDYSDYVWPPQALRFLEDHPPAPISAALASILLATEWIVEDVAFFQVSGLPSALMIMKSF